MGEASASGVFEECVDGDQRSENDIGASGGQVWHL